jgi:hypothetical protein
MASVRSHQLRLRATFRRAVLLLLASPAAAAGCSDDGSVAAPVDASTEDATMGPEAQGDDAPASGPDVATDASLGADATAARDATARDASLDAGPGDADVDAALADGSDADDDAEDTGTPFLTCNDASASAPYVLTDSGTACFYFVDLSCPLYPTLPGSCVLQSCSPACSLDGAPNFGCQYTSDCPEQADAGKVTIMCDTCLGVGRRPAGLVRAARPAATSALGAYFARAAHLEAASVLAFERLRQELLDHDAPPELQRAASRSARDERRHASVTRRLARRFGAVPPPVRMARRSRRSLERIALENAVEGCVRETAGALVATWQAQHAGDEEVRRSMTRIAEDETRHAALAWAVAGWIEGRLSPRARDRVEQARRAAALRLARELPVALPRELVTVAGLPGARDARALLSVLSRHVWAVERA